MKEDRLLFCWAIVILLLCPQPEAESITRRIVCSLFPYHHFLSVDDVQSGFRSVKSAALHVIYDVICLTVVSYDSLYSRQVLLM